MSDVDYSNASLIIGGTEYELTDGVNTIELSDEFPEVNSVETRYKDYGLTDLILQLGFVLILIVPVGLFASRYISKK